MRLQGRGRLPLSPGRGGGEGGIVQNSRRLALDLGEGGLHRQAGKIEVAQVREAGVEQVAVEAAGL